MILDAPGQAWLLTATALVFVMQAGFCFLEVGFVRAKNNINVAIKNVMDFCIAAFLFWLVGYAFLFGPSAGGLIGTAGFMPGDELPAALLTFLLFQMMFCGTATTVVSGAVAERMGYSGYILVSAVLSGLIYPVFGHWAWGGMPEAEPTGWLGVLGFLDFAGATVVHSVGGWLALAAVLIVGPRMGRFGEGAVPLRSHNLSIAAGGTLLLWLGWIGFNGGSVLTDLDRAPAVILHTMVAGCVGGLAGHALSVTLFPRARVEHLLNGILGGLVAITAGANVVSAGDSAIIGAVGGLLAISGERLLVRMRIDDAVGAVPVHLFAGIWGTLALALLGDPDAFGTGLTRWEQLGVQAVGVVACGVYTFGAGYLVLWLINRVRPLRISAEAERTGLNIAEHDASSPMLALIQDMETHRAEGRYDRPVPVEAESDVAPIAVQYNRVLTRVAEEIGRQERLVEELSKAKVVAEASDQAKSQFLATMSHELRTPLNAVIGFSDLIAGKAHGELDPSYVEYAQDIRESGKHLLSLVNDVLDFSRIESGRFDLADSAIDLASLMRAVVRMLVPMAEAGGVEVRVDLPSALPALLADERAVRQILINLGSNAVKFTKPGGRVVFSANLEPDRRICLTVADTGIGMAPEQVARAMEPFTQLHGTLSRRHGGAGLGLSLVKAMARLHGGSLVIQTALDQGTRCHVRFPMTRTLDGIGAWTDQAPSDMAALGGG